MKIMITADWHLRDDVPICRKDDFWEVQKSTLKFINDMCVKNDIHFMLIAGDIFDKPKANQTAKLINLFNDCIKVDYSFVAGNHDLKFHSMEWFKECDISILENKKLKHIGYYNFNEEGWKNEKTKIKVIHKYCQVEKLPVWLEREGITAENLLKEDGNIFITGDNHTGFIYEKNSKIVINPGCITRQTVEKREYKPFIVLLEIDENYKYTSYEKIYLPDTDLSVVENIELDKMKDKNERIQSFLSSLTSTDIKLDFTGNVKRFISENEISKEVENEIDEILEVVR